MSLLTRILKSLTRGRTAEPLDAGDALPAVSAKNQDGQTLQLANAAASGYLLVYFYPKADTPGCTRQACSLRDAYTTLLEKGVRVIGVSKDTPAAQKAFKEKHRLPFDLLADESGEVAAAFGVPVTMGFARRQTFLFKNGVLTWRDLAASTSEQAEELLEVLAAG